jgi:hypothetical protein
MQPTVDGLVLPQQWRSTLTGPTVSNWQCAQSDRWVRGTAGVFRVRDDASLPQVTSLPAGSSTWVWEDDCVVCTDVPTQAAEEEED